MKNDFNPRIIANDLLAVAMLALITGCASFSARIVRTLNCDQAHVMVKVEGFGPAVQLDEEDRRALCKPEVVPTPYPAALAASGPVSGPNGVMK